MKEPPVRVDPWVHPRACADKHLALNDRLLGMETMMREMNDRLYKDNGHKSIQSILNGHEQIIRGVLWLAAVMCASSVGWFLLLLGQMVVAHFRRGG